ncbi:ResB ResB protein required for cytochrome c biosynthesis [Candidatus Nanopelagicaceae bacterium]
MSRETELPELGLVALIRFAWRQLTSMRTALILLMLMGVAAIPGSLIPQRITNQIAVRDLFSTNPELAKWYDRFYLFDVYGSPWFSAIYILLFISLIGCVLPRSVEHYKAMRAQPPATPKNLSRLSHHQELTLSADGLQLAESWFKKNRFRIRNEDGSISAEKGYLRETGNLLFHLSLILILIGVSFGSLFGMRGEAIVSVGERFINVPTSFDTLSFGKLKSESDLAPFQIKVDKFEAKYNPKTNAPEDYTAWVTVKNAGKSSKEILKVNSPLTFGNTRVYLQANGYSPVVTVRDSNRSVVFQGPVPFLPQDGNLRSIGAIKVPDTTPQLGFVSSFVPTNARTTSQGAISIFPELLDPKLLFSIWEGDLGLDSGVPQSVYKIDTKNLKQIALGSVKPSETYSYSGGSITLETVVPWINLQIVEDPGKSYALVGGIVAILGLLSSLYGRRRRIWVRRTQSGVEIAGLAKNSAPGLEVELQKLTKHIMGEK